MNVRLASLIVVTTLLASCAPVQPNTLALSKTWVPQVVTVLAEVEIVGGKDTVVIKSGSACAAHPGEDGCVEIKAGAVGVIQFILDGGVTRSCEGQPDDTWVWKDIQLTAMGNVESSGGSVTKKVGTISSTAQNDFGASRSGAVTAADINGQYMSIRDMNSAAYDIWYTLVAYQCGDATSTATSDPRIKNHGSSDAF